MKYLKLYKKFFEDGGGAASGGAAGGDGGASSGSGDVGGGVAYADASIPGMGAVVSAQPGELPGQTGTEGSGDIGVPLKKKKRKKGDPSEVSDLRDLKKADTVNIKESIDQDLLKDCLIDLLDEGFEITNNDNYYRKHQFDREEGEVGEFIEKNLEISLERYLKETWTGSLTIKCKFDKNGIKDKNITTLRPRGEKLSKVENQYLETCEDISNKLVNLLGYEKGYFTIEFLPSNIYTYTNLHIHFDMTKVEIIK